jgi:chromosomal replication initiation ATPase DnaA
LELKSLSATVAATYDVDPEALFQETRGKKNVAEARQCLIYLYHRMNPNLSQQDLGGEFKRDKSTVRYAIQKMTSCPPQKLIELEHSLGLSTPLVPTGDGMETA